MTDIKTKQIDIFIKNIELLRKSQERKYSVITFELDNIYFKFRGENRKNKNILKRITYNLKTYKYRIIYGDKNCITSDLIIKKDFFYILENLSVLDLFYVNNCLKQALIKKFNFSYETLA
jgi:hypothetical protein